MRYLRQDVGCNVRGMSLYFRARRPVHQILNDRVRYLKVPVHVLVYGLLLICHWHTPFLFR